MTRYYKKDFIVDGSVKKKERKKTKGRQWQCLDQIMEYLKDENFPSMMFQRACVMHVMNEYAACMVSQDGCK